MKSLFILNLVYLVLLLILVEWNPYNYYDPGPSLGISYIVLIILYFCASATNQTITLNASPFKHRYLVNITLVFCAAYFLVLTALRIAVGLSMQEFRNLFFYGSTFGFFSSAFFIYFFIFLNSVIWIGILQSISCRDYSQLWRFALSYVLVDVASGGRMAFFHLIVLLLSTVCLVSSVRLKFRRSNFLNTSFILVFLILVFCVIVASRLDGGDKAFFEFLYQYLVGPSFLYEAELSDGYVSYLISRDYLAWFASLDWAVVGALKLIGFNFDTLYTEWNAALATGRYLNNEYGINAHYTGFLFFKLSFGIFSEIILVGLFALTIYFSAKRSPELAIYFGFILTMMSRENLLNSPQFLVIVFYFLVLKRKRKHRCN